MCRSNSSLFILLSTLLSTLPGLGCAAASTLDDDVASSGPRAAQIDWSDAVRDEAKHLSTRWPGASVRIAVARVDTGVVVASAGPVDEPHVVGSTIKPFTVAKAFDAGLHPGTELSGDPVRVGSVDVSDHHAVSSMTPEGAIVRSSNVGVVRLIRKVGIAAIYPGLAGLLGLPDDAGGDAAATRVLFGGDARLSTLQMVKGYAVLANHGVDPQTGARHVEEASAEAVLAALELAVSSPDGTGHRAAVTGVAVGGKTGTARGPAAGQHTAGFFGVVPADDPTWVVAVVVEGVPDREYGGSVSAPAFARIVGTVFGGR